MAPRQGEGTEIKIRLNLNQTGSKIDKKFDKVDFHSTIIFYDQFLKSSFFQINDNHFRSRFRQISINSSTNVRTQWCWHWHWNAEQNGKY